MLIINIWSKYYYYLYILGNGGSEQLSKLPKIICLVGSKAEFEPGLVMLVCSTNQTSSNLWRSTEDIQGCIVWKCICGTMSILASFQWGQRPLVKISVPLQWCWGPSFAHQQHSIVFSLILTHCMPEFQVCLVEGPGQDCTMGSPRNCFSIPRIS